MKSMKPTLKTMNLSMENWTDLQILRISEDKKLNEIIRLLIDHYKDCVKNE